MKPMSSAGASGNKLLDHVPGLKLADRFLLLHLCTFTLEDGDQCLIGQSMKKPRDSIPARHLHRG